MPRRAPRKAAGGFWPLVAMIVPRTLACGMGDDLGFMALLNDPGIYDG